jgi:hypothetical protein
VTVDGERESATARDERAGATVDDLALEILRVVVDDHRFEADTAGRRFHLVKRTRAVA